MFGKTMETTERLKSAVKVDKMVSLYIVFKTSLYIVNQTCLLVSHCYILLPPLPHILYSDL